MRKSVIAGNWKMHMTCAEAKSYLKEFIPLIKNIKDDRKVVIAPPFTAISTFSNYSDFKYLDISSQNIHWEDQGAFTAEISPKMLIEHGVSYAIVGHSEPRKYFSESDEQINKRAVFAQSSGLTPIVCVGETLEQRELSLIHISEPTRQSLISYAVFCFTCFTSANSPYWFISNYEI